MEIDSRKSIQCSGGNSHALILLRTVPEDQGEYVAVATNRVGKASSSAVLDVTGNTIGVMGPSVGCVCRCSRATLPHCDVAL